MKTDELIDKIKSNLEIDDLVNDTLTVQYDIYYDAGLVVKKKVPKNQDISYPGLKIFNIGNNALAQFDNKLEAKLWSECDAYMASDSNAIDEDGDHNTKCKCGWLITLVKADKKELERKIKNYFSLYKIMKQLRNLNSLDPDHSSQVVEKATGKKVTQSKDATTEPINEEKILVKEKRIIVGPTEISEKINDKITSDSELIERSREWDISIEIAVSHDKLKIKITGTDAKELIKNIEGEIASISKLEKILFIIVSETRINQLKIKLYLMRQGSGFTYRKISDHFHLGFSRKNTSNKIKEVDVLVKKMLNADEREIDELSTIYEKYLPLKRKFLVISI